MIKDLFVLWFQMTAAATQTVSQMVKEAPAPAALTQRFLMSLLRSREKKLIPTACTRSCGTTTQDRSVLTEGLSGLVTFNQELTFAVSHIKTFL